MGVSIWEGSKAQGLVDAVNENNIKGLAMVTDVGMCALSCLEQTGWTNANGGIYLQKLYDAIHSNGFALESIRVAPKADIEVYTHNTLDDLRLMIDVIGTFNGIDIIVNGYTLTGDISTTGSKTITVSYMGLTTTFSVTVQTGIPSGYSALDWLELDSDLAQEVSDRYNLNTGTQTYLPSPDARITFKNYTNVSQIGYDVLFGRNKWSLAQTAPIFGYRERGTGIATNTHMNAIYYNRNNGVTLSCLGKEWGNVQAYANKGVNRVKLRYSADGSQATCQLNDLPAATVFKFLDASYSGGLCPMFVPNYNIDTGKDMNINFKTHIGARVGMVKLYQTNTAVGNYIPCKRTSDGCLGYYDLTGNLFYTTGDPDYAKTTGDKCVYAGGKW